MAIYFASDFHLGLESRIPSKKRESIILDWLNTIKKDATELYLLGDLFDYWYEYKQVVPRGHVRLLGKLAELSDSGIALKIFTGNHDMWMFGYLENELGASVFKKPLKINYGNHRFFIAHGDGLGPGDRPYKIMKKLFSNRFSQWCFARLHPNTGIRIMKWFSKKSRESELDPVDFMGAEKEWLIQFAEEQLENEDFDFFVFGHRHLPLDYTLSNNKSRYINTGDWIHHFSYARYAEGNFELKEFRN